jgi:hypothetical protein
MPKRVNRYLWQIGFRDKEPEVFGYCIGMNGCSISFCEDAVSVLPAVTGLKPMLKLPHSVLFQKVKRLGGEFDRAVRRFRFCVFREDAFTWHILRRPSNRDHMIAPVDILPLKTAELAASEAAEYEQLDHRPVHDGFFLKQLEQLERLLFIEVFCFNPGNLRWFDAGSRVRWDFGL